MWTIKELKKSARNSIKKNYVLCIAICFILTFFTSDYSSSLYLIHDSNNSKLKTENVVENYSTKSSLEYAFGDMFSDIKGNIKNINITSIVNNQVDSLTQSHRYIFKFIGVFNRLFNKDFSDATLYLILGILELIYTLFVANLIIVGARNAFILNSQNNSETPTKIGEFTAPFKSHHIKNIAYIMFIRMIFYFLWSLTIIGLFIKIYEYRMIPFILSEHPEMKRKDVFALSKKLMYKNKFKAFLLDLSFIGWEILSFVTFGLVGIFYSNSYHLATFTELYLTLKKHNQLN